MEVEVQAAIIKAASDWTLFILKGVPSPELEESDKALEALKLIFRRAYEKIGNVVAP